MGERHLLWIVNIWRQTESVCLSVYDRKPSSQHMLTSWTSSGTNRKHNLHISPPVDTWSHTCTHRISKSTSTACHITIKWTTHTKLLPRTRCEIPPPATPLMAPLISIVWLTGQVWPLDWFAKDVLLPTCLLPVPRPFIAPPFLLPRPSFPSPFVWLHTQGERTGSKCRLNTHVDKNTEYIEGARKRDVLQSQRSGVGGWRGGGVRLAV